MLLTLSANGTSAVDFARLLHRNPGQTDTGDGAVVFPTGADGASVAVWMQRDAAVEQQGRAAALARQMERVFGEALAGRCPEAPALAATPRPLEATVTALSGEGQAGLAERLFAPLGYAVTTETLGPGGRRGPLSLRLARETTLQEMLTHVTVLLPLLDEADVDDDESRDGAPTTTEGAGRTPTTAVHRRVCDVLLALDAHRVIDLGCGDGALAACLLADRRIDKVLAVDVAPAALTRAALRMHVEDLAPLARARIELVLGSAVYRDERWRGYDAVAMLDVLDAIPAERRRALERAVLDDARPRVFVATTPNAEHAATALEAPPAAWTRAEFGRYAQALATRYGLRADVGGIGDEHPEHGAPTLVMVLTR